MLVVTLGSQGDISVLPKVNLPRQIGTAASVRPGTLR